MLNISLIPYDKKDYILLLKHVTSKKVKDYFGNMIRGEVVRYELDNINALNFVLYGALDGGVTRSLRIDKHGKTLGFHLLEMELDIESSCNSFVQVQME
jgi:hypothetical protein